MSELAEMRKRLGRVAVLMGGASAEREVSLVSGAAVLAALERQGIDAVAVDAGRDLIPRLQELGVARAFIALHGRGGEDGVVQGALEWAGIPYTGTGVLGSAIGMDKARCKQLWVGNAIPTPRSLVLTRAPETEDDLDGLCFPLAVKPATEGSSIGISKVRGLRALQQAWAVAAAFDPQVLVEEWIEGDEYTATFLGEAVLPMIRLVSPNEFYDYQAKYESDDTRYLCPCGLPVETEARFADLVNRARAVVGARDWGRIDFMVDADGSPWLLEINTVPGMTSHSLVPMAAKAAGLDFDQLVLKILGFTLERDGAAHG